MSSSPFASLDLATLTFTVGDGAPAIDSQGNWAAPPRSLTIEAFLVAASSKASVAEAQGEALNTIVVSGYVVDNGSGGMTMPPELLPGARAAATIGGQSGVFVLTATTKDPFGAYAATGDPISGTFTIRINQGSFA